ncbi:MAG: hypothetical protein ACQEXO_09880 [Pseudomonadota bacterium]
MNRGRGTVLALMLWLGAVPVSALERLYDDATLSHWAAITPEDIRGVFRESLLPALEPEERQRLADVTLVFPPRCPLPALEPFCYYQQTLADGRRQVVMSVTSLRLFGDLALATAWLQLEGLSIETPPQYLTMLRHRQREAFSGGRYPLPLEVLGIPDDVREQVAVMDLYGKLYTSALVFVLLHELGHALHRHPGYGPEVSRETARGHEAEADDFALAVMARLAYPPLGMAFFFTLMAHWEANRWHFADEAAYRVYLDEATHPLTSDRLRGLAAALVEYLEAFARAEPDPVGMRTALKGAAEEIRRLATFMDDPEVQAGILRLGRATDPSALGPRRQGERFMSGGIGAAPVASADLARHYVGTFRGELGDASASLPVLVQLERHGDRVSGAFSYGLGVGQLEGEVIEGRLHFVWSLGADRGQGRFEALDAGARLSGQWGWERSAEDGGRWELWRQE